MLIHKNSLSLAALGLVMVVGANQATAQQPATHTPQVQQFLQSQDAGFLRTSEVLGIPTSHCGHVIDLMMQNQLRARLGANGAEQLHLPHLTVGLTPGDLELVCTNLVSDGDVNQGPVFQIGMRNNSAVPIGNFRVSLVGVLGQIHVHSPTTTVCIDRMEAGEEKHIQVQLPVTCLCMGPVTQRAEFDTLIVALDSHDQLLECDELNNVRILKRCDVALVGAETPQTNPPAVSETAPVTAPETQDAPAEDDSPLDDLDNLDLEDLGLESAHRLNVTR